MYYPRIRRHCCRIHPDPLDRHYCAPCHRPRSPLFHGSLPLSRTLVPSPFLRVHCLYWSSPGVQVKTLPSRVCRRRCPPSGSQWQSQTPTAGRTRSPATSQTTWQGQRDYSSWCLTESNTEPCNKSNNVTVTTWLQFMVSYWVEHGALQQGKQRDRDNVTTVHGVLLSQTRSPATRQTTWQ